MVRAFDSNASRTLGFDEFTRLHNFLINVQQSFHTHDKDKSGRLTTVGACPHWDCSGWLGPLL
jgi:hypothetical protein